jgi:hypothetical protein
LSVANKAINTQVVNGRFSNMLGDPIAFDLAVDDRNTLIAHISMDLVDSSAMVPVFKAMALAQNITVRAVQLGMGVGVAGSSRPGIYEPARDFVIATFRGRAWRRWSTLNIRSVSSCMTSAVRYQRHLFRPYSDTAIERALRRSMDVSISGFGRAGNGARLIVLVYKSPNLAGPCLDYVVNDVDVEGFLRAVLGQNAAGQSGESVFDNHVTAAEQGDIPGALALMRFVGYTDATGATGGIRTPRRTVLFQ